MEAPLSPGSVIQLRSDQHRSFDDLIACLTSMQSWALGTMAHAGYETLDAVAYMGTLDSIAVPDIALHFNGYALAECASQNTWPTSFDLHVIQSPPRSANPSFRMTTVHRILESMTAGMFLRFYESIADDLAQHHGPVRDRPATAQFARTVRNAIAHGTIDIRDERPPGSWRGTLVSPDQNGQPLIHVHLGPADLLVLALDLEALLPTAS